MSGKEKISLNEIAFGSTVFAGSTEMLGYCAEKDYIYLIRSLTPQQATGLALTISVHMHPKYCFLWLFIRA